MLMPPPQAQEFGARMRAAVLQRMPVLSARIHRPPDPETDGAAPEPPVPAAGAEWSWPAAEERLRDAFERGGFGGWAYAAMLELEAEGRAERTKRGHA